jgi:hypothetical protein
VSQNNIVIFIIVKPQIERVLRKGGFLKLRNVSIERGFLLMGGICS